MIHVYRNTETDFLGFGLEIIKPISIEAQYKLNGLNAVVMTAPYKSNTNLVRDNIVKVEGKLFRITRIEKIGGSKETLRCYIESALFADLLDDDVDLFAYSSKSMTFILSELLKGTIFTAGDCDDFGLCSITVAESNKLLILKTLISDYGCEIAEVGNVITLKHSIGKPLCTTISSDKNLKGIKEIEDISRVVTQLKYTNQEKTMFKILDSPYISNYSKPKVIRMEFDAETEAELDQKAAAFLSANDKPYINYEIDLIELSRTVEYASFKELESVNVGDIVSVYNSNLNISISAKILEKRENLVTHKNTKVVIGNFSENYFSKSVSIADTKSTVDYAFKDRKLNVATLRGLRIIDQSKDKVSFEIKENGSVAIDISGNETTNAITTQLNVESGRIDSLITDVSGNKTEILQTKESITILSSDTASNKASIQVNASTITSLVSNVSDHETRIVQNANQILLKASKDEVNTLTGRVYTAESSITQNANSISTKVSGVDFNGNNIASKINQTATTIAISAGKIDLDGIVRVANTLYVGPSSTHGTIYLNNGASIKSRDDVSIGNTIELSATDLWCPTIYMNGERVATEDYAKNNAVARFG